MRSDGELFVDSPENNRPNYEVGRTNVLKGRINENSQPYIRDQEELLTLNWHCVSQKTCAAM